MQVKKISEILQSIAEQLSSGPDNKNSEEIKNTIINFFTKNPNAVDSDVHALADKLGIEHSDFEGRIYKVLIDILAGKFFKGWNLPDSQFNPKELAMGIEVEKEHTDNPVWAKIIAKAHLSEKGSERYYTALKKMEDELKSGK